MLLIREAQIKIFENHREADFKARLFERLQIVAGQSGVASHQVEQCLESGKRFFSTENDLARYVEFVFTRMGGWSGVDHPPAVLRLLASRAVPALRRLENVEYWLAKTKKVHAPA